MDELAWLKMAIREEEYPMFSDEQLQFYLSENKTKEQAAYECLIVKAENSGIKVTGVTTNDMSKYFKMLAQKYRPNNSGSLMG